MKTNDTLNMYTVAASGCWIWSGSVDRNGYGRIAVARKYLRAHRFFYEKEKGATPLPLDHLCRNRLCVNPAHLEPVTVGENNKRGMSFSGLNARKQACKYGHPFDAANTGKVRGRSRRVCKACDARRHREAKTRAACGASA